MTLFWAQVALFLIGTALHVVGRGKYCHADYNFNSDDRKESEK